MILSLGQNYKMGLGEAKLIRSKTHLLDILRSEGFHPKDVTFIHNGKRKRPHLVFGGNTIIIQQGWWHYYSHGEIEWFMEHLHIPRPDRYQPTSPKVYSVKENDE